MQINKTLIWDYDFKGRYETEEFRKWYIGRALSSGTIEDLRGIGINTIREYLPILNLSQKIRKFWEWYFKYADTH